ncbi:MAG: Na+:solute symporter [Deltaproteobacteria bacterium]|nr:Na+:solute symporter [Deltaproteobacteria bacterium]
MGLATIDLVIVVGYVVVSVGIGLYFSRRATKSVEEYFVAGRSLPWWLAGVSMIASAFAIDTPLGIAGLVERDGIQGVWFAWTYIIGGAGTFGAFVFAALLRRSDIVTTAELIELRYAGRGAALLRGFKGVYFGVLSVAISMGWVMRSVLVIAEQSFGWDATWTLVIVIGLTIAYTTTSGLWGVAVTDFIQFFVGSAGSIALAYYALGSAGGISGLVAALGTRYGVSEAQRRLRFLPRPDDRMFYKFLVFVTLKWWGNPPAALNQRLMSTKDERHATFSQLLFTVVHFALNYWPMILVALVAITTFPERKAEHAYALLLVKVLPSGMLGLMLASITAAFMSTIDTQANTGASFIVTDIYRRFIKRNASTAHYVRASQIGTLVMLGLAVVIAIFMDSVKGAWEYLATMTAGYGFVVVARWFWWRISAWTEFAALAGSAVGSLIANHVLVDQLTSFGARFGFVAAFSTACWIGVTLVTPPPDLDSLARFCRMVRPFPMGWGPVREKYDDIRWSLDGARRFGLWGVGLVLVFSLCFGSGYLLFGELARGVPLVVVGILCLFAVKVFWPDKTAS